MITAVRVICIIILLSVLPFRVGAEDFTDAIHAYLQEWAKTQTANVGIVIGIVDGHDSSIISCGKLDNGTGQDVNGDTVFEIGSITKTFTALLLQDMVQRGEMKLDDPVAKYLPKSVKMPTRNGKEITLLQLATHTSGFPKEPDNIDAQGTDNYYGNYTTENLYAFLSACKLTSDPGTKWEYSNLGMALLGHVIALKAGTNYESLLVDRICRPLKMDSTRITLSPEQKSRFATGHIEFGYAVPGNEFQALMACGALRSTANDLLKYVSANLGLTTSSLTPLIEKTHVAQFHQGPEADYGLAWKISRGLGATTIISHGGVTRGYFAFVGFDTKQRRGVVVMFNAVDTFDVVDFGDFLLKCEWRSDHRPTEAKISDQLYDSYVGQYKRLPSGTLNIGPLFLNAPQSAIYSAAAIGLVWVATFFFRPGSFHNRRIILGSVVLVSGLIAGFACLMSKHKAGDSNQPGIGIRREGDRLFAQATGGRGWPVIAFLSPMVGELLPESDTCFFERLSGLPMTFSRNVWGGAAYLTVRYHGNEFSYKKISNQAPTAPKPPKPPVAIQLDRKLLDACVGQYEFAPNDMFPAGMKLRIWRQEDQLVGQALGKNVVHGPFNIYPASETNFFTKVDYDCATLTFIKNDKGDFTAVKLLMFAGSRNYEGKKLKGT